MRRAALAIFLLLLAAGSPSAARSQALTLQSLRFPTTSIVGPWVSYRVRTRFRSLAAREYTQRVAIVGKDVFRGQDGFWVELKTEGLPSGTRIERGFFTMAPESLPTSSPPSVRLVRYQVLTSGGKLYEYPVSSAAEPRAGGEVSTVELFEYDPAGPADHDTLGPDTLRIGRRVVPTIVERTRMSGASAWPVPGDRFHINRPVLTQTFWRNPAVPITGLARSLFQVTMHREPAPDGDSAAADTSRTPQRARAAPDSAHAAPQVVTETTLTLIDLGADAVPEVTQTPEEGESPTEGTEGRAE